MKYYAASETKTEKCLLNESRSRASSGRTPRCSGIEADRSDQRKRRLPRDTKSTPFRRAFWNSELLQARKRMINRASLTLNEDSSQRVTMTNDAILNKTNASWTRYFEPSSAQRTSSCFSRPRCWCSAAACSRRSLRAELCSSSAAGRRAELATSANFARSWQARSRLYRFLLILPNYFSKFARSWPNLPEFCVYIV